MASLQTVLSTFALLQQNLGRPEIVDLIAKNDRITISFRHFMSFGNITEVVLLNTYLKFLKRDKLAEPFRLLVNLDWGSFPRGLNSPLVFDISVSNDLVQKMMTGIGEHENGDHVSADELVASVIGDEADVSPIAEGVSIYDVFGEDSSADEVDESNSALKKHCAPAFRKRKSKKREYKPKTVAQYSSKLSRIILQVINTSDMPENTGLRNQILEAVFKRLNRLIGISYYVNNMTDIVGSIKSLTVAMKVYGINDIEQVRYMEGLALAVSGGGLSVAKLVAMTGLSKRV